MSFSKAIVNRQQPEFDSWGGDSENPQKEDNPPPKPKKSRAKMLGCAFVTSAGFFFGGGSALTLQVLGFTTPTDVTLTTTINGEFQSNEPDEKLCNYSAVACCSNMEDILDDEELTRCITDSCDVTDVSDRRLSLFDGFRSFDTVMKQINLVQSLTFETLYVSEKKTTVEDLAVAVQTEDTTR
jgi:hypothetical protein